MLQEGVGNHCHQGVAMKTLPRSPFEVIKSKLLLHPHALRRNISATSSGVFITCPRGSIHDELSVIRSSFIRSLLGYPRRGQFLMTPRGQFSMARDNGLWLPMGPLTDPGTPRKPRPYAA